jgi:hypothetical protein
VFVFVDAAVEAEVQVEEVEAEVEVSRHRGMKEGTSRRVHVVARSWVHTFHTMEGSDVALAGPVIA